eukprot:CAMPEP_0172717300 /NCGR_PEP_ID=MMETSP1074-20121228/71004_1 /TAXON_ID=2916 /ORGANISM="Ceratium fusus, Strain PA161109" /LENGTH=56 /DNA_ID=CAMNT_0013542209 /DNA_START=83 /DNA_END=254 /DNA_ORIENTATION=-
MSPRRSPPAADKKAANAARHVGSIELPEHQSAHRTGQGLGFFAGVIAATPLTDYRV